MMDGQASRCRARLNDVDRNPVSAWIFTPVARLPLLGFAGARAIFFQLLVSCVAGWRVGGCMQAES